MTNATLDPLTIPAPDADASTLRDHYRLVGRVFAAHTYETTVNLCQTCCREGENTCGKEGGFGRHRYCSAPCEALWQRWQKVRSAA